MPDNTGMTRNPVPDNSKVIRMHPRLQAVAAAALLMSASAAFAQTFPDGTACPGFDLVLQSVGDGTVSRTFTDRNGNVVKQLVAGKGNQLTFINATTQAKIELRANGAVNIITPQPDGSKLMRVMGHNVLILFPTDFPAGPTTTLYVGQVTFTVAAGDVFTLIGSEGRSLDICALLSQ